MTNPSKSLTVTAIVNDGGKITAFFNEMPGILVQGDSKEDVAKKLKSLLNAYLKRLDAIKNNIDIQTTSLA